MGFLTMKIIRSYSELRRLNTFKERFDYLRIGGVVGESTFGFDRYLNQQFYRSPEWKDARRQVIIRDNGCDLGIEDREILDRIYIHHLNPIAVEDVVNRDPIIFNPEYLICCSFDTHQAIHFGDEGLLTLVPKERTPGDTCPWR